MQTRGVNHQSKEELMKLSTRGPLVAMLAVAAFAVSGGTAMASIDASPDSVASGNTVYGLGGSLSATSALGLSTCSSIDVDLLVGTVGGAGAGTTGSVTALADNGSCSGVLTGITFTSNWSVNANTCTGGAATGHCSLSISIPTVTVGTIVGTCKYSATLTGTWTNPGSFSVSGTATKLSGSGLLCSSSPTLTAAFTSGTVQNVNGNPVRIS
jgi:hypothetical protein